MSNIRVIPIILIKNGRVVQSKYFKRHQVLGTPSMIVSRLTNWLSDELIFLDISRYSHYDLNRDDLNFRNLTTLDEIIKHISTKCFMPLTVGGGIRNIQDIEKRLECGADKVSINKMAIEDLSFIEKSSKVFGSQCIVASIDVKQISDKKWEIYKDYGKTPTGLNAIDYVLKLQNAGAGEILLNSVDRDGSGKGYDLNLVKSIVNKVQIPIIAQGGVGNWKHFGECIDHAKPSAVSASNIFQYSENSVHNAMSFLYDHKYKVRKPNMKMITHAGE